MTPGRAIGFTVLELVIVLVIMGILAGVAVASLPSGLLGSGPDLQRAEDQFVGALRLARSRSFGCGGGAREVAVTLASDSVTIEPDCGGSSATRSTDFASGVALNSPQSTLTFSYPFGNIKETDGSFTVTLDEVGGSESRTVCIYGSTGGLERGGCS
jgi:prepilin-type N-terminal cleavage/methylation domain-containing protein